MRLRLFVLPVMAALLTALALGGPSLARRPGPPPVRVKHSPKFAVLLGRNEISPTTGRRGAGDLNGRGSATVLVTDTHTVCFGITVTGLTGSPTAAHIHQGRAGKNGPIVVPLTAPSSGNPGASSGCVSTVPPAVAAAINRHPRQFYVNVHTTMFPGGAVRGQLFNASDHD